MAATLRGHGRQRDEAHVRQPCHGIGRCQIHHRKKALKPCEKRTIIGAVRQERPKDIGKACRLLRLSRVIWVLKHLVNRYGKPENIRMDNGPEFIAKIAQNWSKINGETHSKRLSG